MADWMPVLVAQAWQVTLLIVAVASINRWAGKSRPHLAHALWLVVLVKCVTPPVWSSPSGLFCWLQPARETIRESLAVEPPLRDWSELVATARHSQNVEAAPHEDAGVESDVEAEELLLGLGDVSKPVAELPSPVSTDKVDWPHVLLGAWAFACLVVIGVAVVRCLRCWRMLRNAPQRECLVLSEQLDSLAKKLGLRRRVRLIVTESRLGPAVIGLFRTTVLLPALIVDRLENSVRRMAAPGRPASFDTQTRTAEGGHPTSPLTPILAHELLHIRRGDLWVGLLQTLAQAVWWCHPLVWWVNRRTTREAERCCDEEVLAELGCDPAAYARALVDVLELKRELKPVPVFPGVRPVEVTSQRLERIMQLGQGCQRRTPWWCWLLAGLAAAATWPGAAFVVTAEDGQKLESPKSAETTRKVIHGTGVNSDAGVTGEVVLESSSDKPAAVSQDSDKVRAEEFWPALHAWISVLGPIPDGNIAEIRVEGNRLVSTEEFLAMIQSKPGQPTNAEQLRKDVKALLVTRRFTAVYPQVRKSDKGPVLVFRVFERSVLEQVEFSGNKLIATEDLERVAKLKVGSPFDVSDCSKATRRLTEHYRSNGFSTAIIYPKFEPTKGDQLRDYKVIFVIVEGAKGKVPPPLMTEKSVGNGSKLELDSLGQLSWQQGSWFVAVLPAPGTKLIDTGELPKKFRSDGQAKVFLSKIAQGFNSKDQIVMSADEFELFAAEHGQQIRLGGGVHLNGSGFQANCDSLVLSLSRGDEAAGIEPQNTALLGQARLRRQVNGERTELKAEQILLYLNGTAITQIQQDGNDCVVTLRDPPVRDAALIQQGRSILAFAKPEKIVSVQFDNVPLKDAIKQLAQSAGRNIVLDKQGLEDEGLMQREPVTLSVDQVKLSSVLTLLLDPLKLGYHVEESGTIVVTSKQRLKKQLLKGEPVVVAYAVGDLTPLIPRRVTVNLTADQGVVAETSKPGEPANSMKQQLHELTNFIESTCQPDSWEHVAGNGSIKVNETTLSLVVRQTQDVHREIRDLLEEMRRQLDLQAALQVETLTVPADFWSKVGKNFDDPEANVPPSPQSEDKYGPRRLARLTKKEAALLRSLSKIESAPKVTLFSGQELDIHFGGKSPMRLGLKPVVTTDRAALRVQAVAVDSAADFDLSDINAVRLESGHSLLLDATELSPAVLIPTDRLVNPHVPFKAVFGAPKPANPGHRTLLLITGQVVIVEEEEVLLGVPQ